MTTEGWLRVPAAGGDPPMRLYRSAPAAPAPALLVFGDNAGVREELRQHTRALSQLGFFAVLGDPYYRAGVSFAPPLSADDRARIAPLRQALSLAQMASDVVRIADALAETPGVSPGVSPGGLALLGLCIGSGWVLAGLEALGDRARAAVLLDPCELGDRAGQTPRSLPPVAVQVACPAALSAYGDDLVARLAGWGARPERAPDAAGAGHGFCFPSWPGGVYDVPQQRAAFAAAGDFLRREFAADARRR